MAPQPRKGFQNLGFDGDLWILSAAAGRKYPAGGMCLSGALHRVLQITAAGGRTGRAMTEGARAAVQAGGGGLRAARPTQDAASGGQRRPPLQAVQAGLPFFHLAFELPPFFFLLFAVYL
ncbi:MAG: hypothetical protein EGQ75_02835 [Clostridiales bacterium]|nr:hypothetical protein [Clostridiales bacterium]MBD9139173.1 hypothetical protein [Clostridiales bacterium]